jgi:hypothetical protein
LRQRRDLTPWLMATTIAGNVSQPGRAEVTGLQDAGPGVRRGTLDGFPTFLVDLQAVPFSPDTIPLHMVAGGRQERALVEYILAHYKQYPNQLDLLPSLHDLALMEALLMHNLTPEQIGIDYDALSRILKPEHFLKHHSVEEVLRYWARQHSIHELREIIDRIERTSNGPSEPAPPQT